MRVGICDDDDQARLMVAGWLKNRPEVPDRNVFEFCSGRELVDYLHRSVLDLIFLDCKMAGMDGIETARAIRERDGKVVIVLLTDYASYALFGYGADILDYVLKKDFLAQADRVFDRALRRIQGSKVQTYAVKTGAGLFLLDISDILYIESTGRKKKLFVRGGHCHEFYGKIDDIENDLRKYGFVRPHNSYLVNSRYVKVFMPHNLWLAGLASPLPVARARYKAAYNDMTVFASEGRL